MKWRWEFSFHFISVTFQFAFVYGLFDYCIYRYLNKLFNTRWQNHLIIRAVTNLIYNWAMTFENHVRFRVVTCEKIININQMINASTFKKNVISQVCFNGLDWHISALRCIFTHTGRCPVTCIDTTRLLSIPIQYVIHFILNDKNSTSGSFIVSFKVHMLCLFTFWFWSKNNWFSDLFHRQCFHELRLLYKRFSKFLFLELKSKYIDIFHSFL